MIEVSIVVGNPKPRSRTARVATLLVEALLPASSFELSLVDLADHVHHIFDWPSKEMMVINEKVAQCDLLVVASPTYKGTYTGLLKAFFDRYPNLGLRGVVAIPVMTGNDARHAMAPEFSLRPLLVELGAVVPTQGLYFTISQMGEVDTVVPEWVQEARERVSAHLPSILSPLADRSASRSGAL